jgi:hypothetical protein
MTKTDSTVVKKSISLSGVVSIWADGLAAKKGFGTNYSAYIADLIRRDKEREDDLELSRIYPAGARADRPDVSSAKKRKAADAIVGAVQQAARKKTSASRSR